MTQRVEISCCPQPEGVLALAAGAVLELASGVPRFTPLPFFVLAYLSGGYYSTRNAIAALRERTVDVNLLMVTAAVGAATIDYWQGRGGRGSMSLPSRASRFRWGRGRAMGCTPAPSISKECSRSG